MYPVLQVISFIVENGLSSTILLWLFCSAGAAAHRFAAKKNITTPHSHDAFMGLLASKFKGLFTLNESKGENEKDQRKNDKHQRNIAFASTFARVNGSLNKCNQNPNVALIKRQKMFDVNETHRVNTP